MLELSQLGQDLKVIITHIIVQSADKKVYINVYNELAVSIRFCCSKMKKTLVIMGTHPNGLKSFDWTRSDCDIWMFNEAPNTKKANGELMYPKSNATFQLHHEAIWKNPKNRNDKDHYL